MASSDADDLGEQERRWTGETLARQRATMGERKERFETDSGIPVKALYTPLDVAGNDWSLPRKEFHSHLRRLVEGGFGKRILFGSDAMIWPQTIEVAIQSIESADFLTAEQKRDIFYNNAARFLRLEPRKQLP